MLISTDTNYSNDLLNYFKLLNFTENKVMNKLIEIVPSQNRKKRGIINGLGSIFKSITGNLDANDGERFETLIKELQNNQINLATNIKEQNSVSFALIEKFNKTIQQITNNEHILTSRIKIIESLMNEEITLYRFNYIKDSIVQIINIFEITNSILQDIENSISFAKIQVMHPSIIKTIDLYNQLKLLEKYLNKNELPLEINLNNVLLFEKLIKIDCFIFNNKITFILKIPVVQSENFNLYHLFAVPIWEKSQFKVIIPRKKFLVKNKSKFAFTSNPCTEIIPRQFVCPRIDLLEIEEDGPCEIQLLEMKITSTCEKTSIRLSKPLLKQLANSNHWIYTVPYQDTAYLKCPSNEETKYFTTGTYLVEIPKGCQLTTHMGTISNQKSSTTFGQPVLILDLDNSTIQSTSSNFNFHLENIELDDLQAIKSQITHNQPKLSFEKVLMVPSLWTLIIYGTLVFLVMFFVYKKLMPKICRHKKLTQSPIDPTAVQLPSS